MMFSILLLLVQIQSVRAQTLLSNLITNLEQVKGGIDTKLFLYQNPLSQWEESSVYRFDDFLESLKVMSTSAIAGKKFYIGEDVTNGHVYGLVNIAAFLAQSMKETIKYDACDESSWDSVGGKYPLSNACGQLVSLVVFVLIVLSLRSNTHNIIPSRANRTKITTVPKKRNTWSVLSIPICQSQP